MKKLIALFAILVAFTATTFAASDNATATVNVWNPIVVVVDLTTAPAANILVTETTKAVFTVTTLTYDVDYSGGITGAWTYTYTGTPSIGTWSTPVENSTLLTTESTFTAAAKGVSTMTATYTANYNF